MERSAKLRAFDAEHPDPFEAARQGSVEHFGASVAGLRDYLLLVANRELTTELRARRSALRTCCKKRS